MADQSVIVVRTSATEIKAYQNACRHRATQLAVGCGTFRGGQIVCPFHGWRWNLDGTSSFVYGRDSFPPECVTDADLHLVECQVDTWANCVFINMDPDAPPLQQQLAPMPSLLDPLNVGLMRVYWWKAVKLKANWKLAMEAFMEGFHVPQTHPQLTFGSDGAAGSSPTSTRVTASATSRTRTATRTSRRRCRATTPTRTGRPTSRPSSWPMRRARCRTGQLRS